MSSSTKRFRKTNGKSPVQVASARRLEMAIAQPSEGTLTTDQLIRNGALSTKYLNSQQSLRRVPPLTCDPIPEKQVENLVAGFLNSIDVQPGVARSRPRYHIMQIASEMAPVAKVGGLADVVTGLGRSLQKKGHRVEIILPKYKYLDVSGVKNFKKLNKEYYSVFDGVMHKNVVWTGVVEGLWVYFIDTLHPDNFFYREKIYCEPDDFRRFTYFSRAALEFMYQFGKRPDVIHLHDWPVAVVAPLYRSIYAGLGFNSRIAFTCHNFEPQGKETLESLLACGLQFKGPVRRSHFQDKSPDKINVLKAGLLLSDIVTTVSPTYAKEVLTVKGGEGLHTTIRTLSKKFRGIVNGIDANVWNPATDPHIDHHFSSDDLKGKEIIKNNLRQRLGMAYEGEDAKRPLVCCVSRLVPQKGVHLLRAAIFHTLERGGQFILQGTSQVPAIKKEFDELAIQFENHPHIRLVLRVEETLTHNIFSAADIFVIPSIFEPCGLTQLYAMRYGAIPLVRRTGGLADTVFDVELKSVALEKRNGFTFMNADGQSVTEALDRALSYYNNQPQWWRALVHKVMSFDFSWDSAPVNQYINLYEKAVEKAGSSPNGTHWR